MPKDISKTCDSGMDGGNVTVSTEDKDELVVITGKKNKNFKVNENLPAAKNTLLFS